MHSTDDSLVIAGRSFRSRLIGGTGKFDSFATMADAIDAAGVEIVTVAVRRIDFDRPDEDITASIPERILLLPNTAGCETADEAVRVARLARAGGLPTWIKLEVIPDPRYLLPDPLETLRAAATLVEDGFTVLPYVQPDPVLQKKLEDEAFRDMPPVPEDVLQFVAHRAKGSVRDLEGLLTRVVFQASFLGIPPSLEVAQSAFQGSSGQEAQAHVPLDRIYRAAAETFGLSYADLMKKRSRQQGVLLPRQVAMFLARELTAASFGEIGKSFGNMHHSTVMNAIDSVKARMHKDSDFHKILQSLLNSIG